MPDPSAAPDPHRLRLGDLPRSVHPVELVPDSARMAALAAQMGLSALRKARLDGRLEPVGAQDWDLRARLGATVVQPCGVTLAPVTTRLDEAVMRRFRTELPAPPPGESEMPEDDDLEPMPALLDLATVFEEALALAIPPFPRAEGVEAAPVQVSAPGVQPLRDEDLKPFAGLEALKRRMDGDGDED